MTGPAEGEAKGPVTAHESLRRAAALMRARAIAATPGPWGVGNDTLIATEVEQVSRGHCRYQHEVARVVEDIDREDSGNPVSERNDAEHIASWHPHVAIAVAELLERQAAFIEKYGDFSDVEDLGDANALSVALAYLGSDA